MNYTINELKILEIFNDIKSDENELELTNNTLVRKHYQAKIGAKWEVLQIILNASTHKEAYETVHAIAQRA